MPPLFGKSGGKGNQNMVKNGLCLFLFIDGLGYFGK
jgi:hypothetical protein